MIKGDQAHSNLFVMTTLPTSFEIAIRYCDTAAPPLEPRVALSSIAATCFLIVFATGAHQLPHIVEHIWPKQPLSILRPLKVTSFLSKIIKADMAREQGHCYQHVVTVLLDLSTSLRRAATPHLPA